MEKQSILSILTLLKTLSIFCLISVTYGLLFLIYKINIIFITTFFLVVFLIYLTFKDYSLEKKIFSMKPFLKKGGNYYFKKEGHIVSIYIIDPMSYKEHDKNSLVAYIEEGCYIEKHGRKIKAFYLPKANLDEAEIYIDKDGISTIEKKEYYKVDLGSGGRLQKYIFPCALIMDDKQNVEVIQIEQ